MNFMQGILQVKFRFSGKHLERAMKNLKTRLAVLSLSTLWLTKAYGHLTPSGDSYTNTAAPTTNYGSKTLLDVESASQTTYIQFDLSAPKRRRSGRGSPSACACNPPASGKLR